MTTEMLMKDGEVDAAAFSFRPIRLPEDSETVVRFRTDSFIVSFGAADSMGSPSDYLHWLEERMARFPDGFMLLLNESGQPVGQLELQIKNENAENVGYINLYYLTLEYRRRRLGMLLHRYALAFFKSHSVRQYYLLVAKTNHPAISFYRRIGLEAVTNANDPRSLRMTGRTASW